VLHVAEGGEVITHVTVESSLAEALSRSDATLGVQPPSRELAVERLPRAAQVPAGCLDIEPSVLGHVGLPTRA